MEHVIPPPQCSSLKAADGEPKRQKWVRLVAPKSGPFVLCGSENGAAIWPPFFRQWRTGCWLLVCPRLHLCPLHLREQGVPNGDFAQGYRPPPSPATHPLQHRHAGFAPRPESHRRSAVTIARCSQDVAAHRCDTLHQILLMDPTKESGFAAEFFRGSGGSSGRPCPRESTPRQHPPVREPASNS